MLFAHLSHPCIHTYGNYAQHSKKRKGLTKLKLLIFDAVTAGRAGKTYQVIDARLKRQVEEYKNGNDLLQFLRDIARNLH